MIIGAHYDHIGIDESGVLHPGADDNASGISVLIEVAAKAVPELTRRRGL